MKRITLSLLALAACITTGPAFADKIDDTIKARQAFYKLVGFNFGQMVAMAKGEAEYNAEAATKAAANLQALTKMDLGPLFPPGSDNEAKKGKTRALPKIWTDFPGVVKIVGDWQGAVDNLVQVAGTGKGALGPAVGQVGQTCGACHKAYRAENF